ncbi:hypothetical protein GALL_325630 [mine drainage metagenome]|uniref:Uncharacterized protein n=1 Tax=mine drainage metagenome TaxID=410659 RepID=A0A1J5RBS0_9ZZZZ
MAAGQTFRALCPEAKALHVFEVVSEQGKTVAWCTRCRKVFPLAGLSDGRGDDDIAPPARPKRGRKT